MGKKLKAHILKKTNGVGRVPYTDLYAIEPGSLVITRKQVEQLTEHLEGVLEDSAQAEA